MAKLNWKRAIISKLRDKHHVSVEEVEDALTDPKRVQKRVGVDRKRNQRRYLVIGRTASGRMLSIFLDYNDKGLTPVSARDADDKEYKWYTRR
jgi:uncharacterized DUF497 family protein